MALALSFTVVNTMLALAGAAQMDACPGFFGDVNPDTMVVTDASTPGSVMAQLTNDTRMASKNPLVVFHYFPGVSKAPSNALRKVAFGAMVLDNNTMCLMPGAPVVGTCGKYLKTEYQNCSFPTTANLAFGAIDLDANYTVRGSAVGTSGLVKGCENKVVKQTYYCYRRTSSVGPPPVVDCSTCDMPAPPAPPPPTTCAEIKKAYSAQKCCTSPTKAFQMPSSSSKSLSSRRLHSSDAMGLWADVHARLEKARQTGGAAEVEQLLVEIKAVAMQYTTAHQDVLV